MAWLFSVTLLLLMLSFHVTKAYNITTKQLLLQQLLKNYDKNIIPSTKEKAVIIDTGATILHFEMHEQDHAMSVDLLLNLYWEDPRLTWNETEHGGLTSLALDPAKIWYPDLTLYTSTEWRNPTVLNRNTKIAFSSEGYITCVFPTNVRVPCLMDVSLWPYDHHKCKVKIGSWVHHSLGYDFEIRDSQIETESTIFDVAKNKTYGEWMLANASLVRNHVKYTCCPEAYVDIALHISLYRDAPAYRWTVMMPIAVLWLLTFVTFVLPPASGEKILVALLSLLVNIQFLDYTSRTIGHSPTHTPLLVKLVCLQLVMLVLAVLLNALVLSISRGPHTLALPSSLKMPLLRLSAVLGLSSYSHKVSRNDGPDLDVSDRVELEEDSKLCEETGSWQASEFNSQDNAWSWLLLGAVVNRLCLVIYLIIVFLSICFFGSFV